MSKTYPPETDGLTPYTAVRVQSRFHHATTHIYTRVISRPFPSADEMLKLDEELLQPWRRAIPPAFADDAVVPARYVLAHAIMRWRYRNLRIIMYRPFVIRKALRERELTLQGVASSGNGLGDDHYAPGDLRRTRRAWTTRGRRLRASRITGIGTGITASRRGTHCEFTRPPFSLSFSRFAVILEEQRGGT